MPRIFLSLAIIAITGGALTIGATGAFFSDIESSVANVFTAGAIDLKIDNESYYNGDFNENTSWGPEDLAENGRKFFDFGDLKPGDYGEDTISIHVDTNDAFLCGNVTLTSNNDNTQTEPEALVDENGMESGELADLVEFMWWADDGDNVLESDEQVLNQGVLGDLVAEDAYPLVFADSENNIWNEEAAGGAIAGDTTYYIGKAWCFGTLAADPLTQDESDDTRAPDLDNDNDTVAGAPKDGGFTCDGSALGNESQTDSLTADISFMAVQARHNEGFQCERPKVPGGSLTLVKQVFNSGPFNELPSAWTLSAAGPSDISGLSGAAAITNAFVATGTYNLSEVGPQGYSASNWSCTGGTQLDENTVTIADGENVVCTVTNYIACTPQERHADSVVSFDQGALKNGGAVLANRSDPTKALGIPQSVGLPFDNPAPLGEFFSLGFDENDDDTEGGWVVLEFTNNYIVDGPGNDIRAWEITGGTSYPVEKIKIEVSQNGSSWSLVDSSADRDTEADLADSGLTWAKYIRITDVSDQGVFEATADGYDLDAVSALTCASVPLPT